ncbi:MAG TPA: hypothetical protein VN541_17880 [Tepidisphaeraceae bacterium]|nr:hypothetical protein [Tepidisphaeraceae bacterium]
MMLNRIENREDAKARNREEKQFMYFFAPSHLRVFAVNPDEPAEDRGNG